MCSQNEEVYFRFEVLLLNYCIIIFVYEKINKAEELMRKIERDEDQAAIENPERKFYHLCIVNLVIG